MPAAGRRTAVHDPHVLHIHPQDDLTDISLGPLEPSFVLRCLIWWWQLGRRADNFAWFEAHNLITDEPRPWVMRWCQGWRDLTS